MLGLQTQSEVNVSWSNLHTRSLLFVGETGGYVYPDVVGDNVGSCGIGSPSKINDVTDGRGQKSQKFEQNDCDITKVYGKFSMQYPRGIFNNYVIQIWGWGMGIG